MTNTPFSKQCEIISALYLEYGEDPDYSEYFLMNDLGLFVSVLQCFDAVEVKPKAVKWVNNAFFALCDYLGVDEHGDYDSIYDLLELANER